MKLRELYDPLREVPEYPQRLEYEAQFGIVSAIRFSPSGDYLGIGLWDGSVAIVDWDTMAIIRHVRRHTGPVNALNWWPDSSRLLSCSADWHCILWEVTDMEEIGRVYVGSAALDGVLVSPDDAIVVIQDSQAVHADFNDNVSRHLDGLDPSGADTGLVQAVALVAPDEWVVLGTSKGWIYIFHHLKFIRKLRLVATGIVELRAAAEILVINCSDRTVRPAVIPRLNLKTGEWPILRRFRDPVNKSRWISAVPTPTGQYILGSADMAHAEVYVWNTELGYLVYSLTGPPSPVTAMDFHPTTQALAAVGGHLGTVYVWTTDAGNDWSQLIPEFGRLPAQDPIDEDETAYDIFPDRPLNPHDFGATIDVWTRDEPVFEPVIRVNLSKSPQLNI